MAGSKPTPKRPIDPHPENEEHYRDKKRPGGANPPEGRDPGVKVYEHDGDPRRGYPDRPNDG